MPIVAEEYQFVIGVDTHAGSHTFSVIDTITAAELDQAQFPASAAGLARASGWAARRTRDRPTLIAVEGVGSFGAGVARAFAAGGYRVVEAHPQSAGQRRGNGKSDALDAARIARSVLGVAVNEWRTPRADGIRNALRILVVARESMTRERTATINALTALVRTEELGIDARKPLTTAQLRQICSWRARRGETVDVAVARAEATRLARRAIDLQEQAASNSRHALELVKTVAPELLEMPGVGPVTAAIVIVSWSHPGRVRSEAAFAALAGTCPIPASSGNTSRHRLNRGGDRRLNWALHTIVMVRMGRDPQTKEYVARRISEGKTKREAMRCVKRYLTRQLHRTLSHSPALATQPQPLPLAA